MSKPLLFRSLNRIIVEIDVGWMVGVPRNEAVHGGVSFGSLFNNKLFPDPDFQHRIYYCYKIHFHVERQTQVGRRFYLPLSYQETERIDRETRLLGTAEGW